MQICCKDLADRASKWHIVDFVRLVFYPSPDGLTLTATPKKTLRLGRGADYRRGSTHQPQELCIQRSQHGNGGLGVRYLYPVAPTPSAR
jgi:hypothetical protein